jgi:hypothetical protein
MKKILLAAALIIHPIAALAADCSGAIATRGTAIQLIPPATGAKFLMIQNIDSIEALWFSLTGTAVPGTAGSFVLPPSQARGFATSSLQEFLFGAATPIGLSVIAGTVGHKISCTWW